MIARTIIAGIVLLSALCSAGAVERITRFGSDVTVERGGDLLVTETIAVQAEGKEIRRGILRDFPTSYRRSDGAHVEVGFDVLSVTRDGRDEPYATERLSNGVRVRIGRADQLINTGPHTYEIRYRTTRQIGFFADFDELYWNATGTGWTFPIDVVEARITLPETVAFKQTAFYTGPQGARGQDAAIVEQQPGRIVFRTTRPLPAHSGLTVAAAWQKGIVTPPSSGQRAGWLLQDNAALLVALIGLASVIGYYAFIWMVVGRDPPKGTIIPLFGPPAGMSAAGVRYVDQMGFDNRAFAAAIIELGVNGHIKLVDKGNKYTQVHRRKGGKPIGRAEQEMESKLFGSADAVLLSQANHEKIGKARDILQENLAAAYKSRLFKNNYGWSWLGLLGAIVAVVAVAIAIGLTYGSDHATGAITGMLIPVLPLMVAAHLVQSGWRKHSGGQSRILAGVVVGGVGLLSGLGVMYFSSRGVFELLPALTPAVLASFVGLAFGWLQAPSFEGRKVMDQIDGLREYLSVAEEERLEYLNPPEKTPELFERFLPFAIALDVENTWANRFAGVLAAAAAGAAAGAAYTASDWYSGSRDIAGDPVSFVDRIGSDLSTTIASAATPPGSSSGSGGSDSGGGGGSSGGGGGGGGGSGW